MEQRIIRDSEQDHRERGGKGEEVRKEREKEEGQGYPLTNLAES